MSARPHGPSGPPYSVRSRAINHQFPNSNYVFTLTFLVSVQKETLTSTHNIKVMNLFYYYYFFKLFRPLLPC